MPFYAHFFSFMVSLLYGYKTPRGQGFARAARFVISFFIHAKQNGPSLNHHFIHYYHYIIYFCIYTDVTYIIVSKGVK